MERLFLVANDSRSGTSSEPMPSQAEMLRSRLAKHGDVLMMC
jgi:hypothetical protein